MSDSFTELSSKSIFGRLGNSIKGVLIGLILIPVSIFLLSWNEGRAVNTAASLKEGAAAVISVAADTIQEGNQGKLVHLCGEVTTEDTLADRQFEVSQNAIRLTRKVEMFQWTEEKEKEKEKKTHKKLGAGTETETTYTYSKDWEDKLVKSSDFKKPEGHQNPDSLGAKSTTIVAGKVMLGAFRIPEKLISKMAGDVPLAVGGAEAEELPKKLKGKALNTGETFYFGADPANPTIGDQRVTFTVLKPAPFSILARQTAGTLDAYPTKAGREIQRVESGNVPAAEMFQHAEKENSMITWGLRLGGTLLMAIGSGLILSPISTLADVIPILGDIVGMGTFIAALIIAVLVSLVVIAVAWFAVRPALSVVLIAAAIGAVILCKRMAKERKMAAMPAR
jgi:hypothetical protein